MSGGTTHREDVDGNGDYVFDVDTTYATDGENELIVSISYRARWNQRPQTAVRLPVTIANPLRVDPWNQQRYVVPAAADERSEEARGGEQCVSKGQPTGAPH